MCAQPNGAGLQRVRHERATSALWDDRLPLQRPHCVAVVSRRQWTTEVLLPCLRRTPDFSAVELRVDLKRSTRAIAETGAEVVLVDGELFSRMTGAFDTFSKLVRPAKLVLLMDKLDLSSADAVISDDVSGVLLIGSTGPACVTALRQVCGGEIWFPRWLLCRALIQYRILQPRRRTAVKTQTEPAAQLTPRELEICDLVTSGLSNKQIAEEAAISIDTVKKHLRNIYAKHHIHHRTEMIVQRSGRRSEAPREPGPQDTAGDS